MEYFKKLFNSSQTLLDFFAGFLLLSLPISTALPNIFLIPLVLLVIFRFKKFNFIVSKPLHFIIASAVFIIIMASISGDLLENSGVYTRFLLVLLVYLLVIQVKNRKLIEHFFLLGTSIAVVGSATAVGIYSYNNPDFLLDVGSVVNDLLWVERPYFGIILSLGTFICLKNADKYRKNDYYLLALVFIAFSIYISARLSIMLNILLIFVFLFRSFHIQRSTKIWTGFVFALLVAIALGLSDNLMSRMKITNSYEETTALVKDYEPRFVIWPCAVNIMGSDFSLFTGTKSYDEAEQQLVECYAASIEKEEKRNYYISERFNTHNQFLDFLLVGGVIPFLLLVIAFFWAWFSKTSSFPLKMVFVLFFAFFLVENVLHRQLGCYLFGIFVALYSERRHEKN